MILRCDLLDWIVVEVSERMIYLLVFTVENDLLSLLARIRIKTRFPLKRPVINFPLIGIQMSCRSISIVYYEKREVAPAKSLTFVDRSSERSLI